MFKLTKEHEGKSFWCVPTQNNINRYGENPRDALNQAVKKEVSDVKRVYLKLDNSVHSLAEYGQDETRATYTTKNNSGWIVFESESDFIKYKSVLQDTNLIKEKLQRTYGDLRLTDDQTKRIASILREGETNE